MEGNMISKTVMLQSGSPICTVEDQNDNMLSLVWFDRDTQEFKTACVCACAVCEVPLRWQSHDEVAVQP